MCVNYVKNKQWGRCIRANNDNINNLTQKNNVHKFFNTVNNITSPGTQLNNNWMLNDLDKKIKNDNKLANNLFNNLENKYIDQLDQTDIQNNVLFTHMNTIKNKEEKINKINNIISDKSSNIELNKKRYELRKKNEKSYRYRNYIFYLLCVILIIICIIMFLTK